MANQQKDPARKGRQEQASVQSAQQGEKKKQTGKPRTGQQGQSGIGASQGQDRGSPDEQSRRPSAGTPDIERGSEADVKQGGAGSSESLVNDATGPFKERP